MVSRELRGNDPVTSHTVALGQVASFVRGITFKPSDVSTIAPPDVIGCMRTRNVQAELDLTDVWGIPRSLVKSSNQILRGGDLLVSTANSWNLVGKACWVPELDYECTFGGFISVLRPDAKKINPRYLYYWFTAGKTQDLVRNCGRQTTNISNLSTARCLQLKLPLPSLLEQERIAAILEKADEVRRKRELATAKLEELTWNVFLEMFGDPLSNPKGWDDSLVLGDVAEIVSGITKGRKLGGAKVRSVPYLAVSNVQDKALDLSTLKVIDATEEEIRRYRLTRDDLLLTEGGDPDKLGRGTLWECQVPECIHQNHIFRVRLIDDRVRPKFLNWLVGSNRGKHYFLKAAKQTTGIASINMKQLRAFPILLPPIAVQQRFELVLHKLTEAFAASGKGKITLDRLTASLQNELL